MEAPATVAGAGGESEGRGGGSGGCEHTIVPTLRPSQISRFRKSDRTFTLYSELISKAFVCPSVIQAGLHEVTWRRNMRSHVAYQCMVGSRIVHAASEEAAELEQHILVIEARHRVRPPWHL